MFVLDDSEIEHLLILEDVVKALASSLHLPDPTLVADKVKDLVFSELRAQKDQVTSRLALAVFAHKGILSQVSSVFGFKSHEYLNYVKRLIPARTIAARLTCWWPARWPGHREIPARSRCSRRHRVFARLPVATRCSN